MRSCPSLRLGQERTHAGDERVIGWDTLPSPLAELDGLTLLGVAHDYGARLPSLFLIITFCHAINLAQITTPVICARSVRV